MDQFDFTHGQARPTGAVCGYHMGKAQSPCSRCGQPYLAHYPELRRPRRVRGVIKAVCDLCSYPIDSDQHQNHCRG
jgi:hypothetical protein